MTKDLIEVELRNDASIPFQLLAVTASPLTVPRVFTVPARGKIVLQIANVPDIEKFALRVEVLNALVDPEHGLSIALR